MSFDMPIVFVDENGVPYGIERVGNKPLVVAVPFDLEVARGNVPGFASNDKFGRNIQVDNNVTADVWDGGHTGDVSLIWVAPTAAAKHNIASSSANDDGDPAGLGARTLRIFGLPDWDTAEISEDITLNGVGNVLTVNDYVIIHRMEVLTKGATSVNVGTITATATAPSALTITAKIRPGQGQTQMAILGIPSIQKAYVSQYYATVNKAGGAAGLLDTSLLYNPEPDAELLNFLVKNTRGLQTVGSSAPVFPFKVSKVFVGPGILKVQVASGTNTQDVSAGFDVMLINN